MRRAARLAMGLLCIAVLATYLPVIFAMCFETPVGKTHLLFSPTLKKFIWKEKTLHPPEEALRLAEDHHAEFIYRDEDGRFYSRNDFEKHLPFIYYKNMELWGLLPLTLADKTFDAHSIKQNRRVLQLSPKDLRGEPVQVYPLLESDTGQARLVFPEDRYRLTATGLEFINADSNTVDAALSETYSNALAAAGFQFPAKFAAGRFTLLKPYDAGHFLLDAEGALFHLRRLRGVPVVTRTPVAPGLNIRAMVVVESAQHDFYGLLLGWDNRVHLLAEEGYAVRALHTPGYDPERMEFKVLLNPLYVTAVYSDEAVIHGSAMDRRFRPIRTYTHTMARAKRRPAQAAAEALFPFRLLASGTVTATDQGWALQGVAFGGPLSLLGMALSALALAGLRRARGLRPWEPLGLGLAFLSGVYGLAAVCLAWDE